jgi:ankyrin repeat protein
VVEAAAGNADSGKEVIALLLDKRGDDMRMTKDVAGTVVRHFNHTVIGLLSDRHDIRSFMAQHTNQIVAGNLVYVASMNNIERDLKFLLDHGADTNFVSEDGWTPLTAATRRGHRQAVGLLLDSNADMSKTTKDGWTPLMIAASNGRVEVVQLLLEKGVDPLPVSTHGLTALDSAVYSGHVEVAQTLLSNVVYRELDDKRSLNGTIANMLTYKGHTDLLRSIIKHNNANVHAADSHNRTPLLLAARGGHIQSLKYLLSLGLALSTLDGKGDVLISYAASSGSSDVVDAVLALECKPASRSVNWSPLHWAYRAGHAKPVETLIDRGFKSASVRVTAVPGEWTPLAIAVFHGNMSMLADLSEPIRAALGVMNADACIEGDQHNGASCDGCFHVSHLLSQPQAYLTMKRISVDRASDATRALTSTTASCANRSLSIFTKITSGNE